MFLKPFNRACVESLSIMTAYSSYDGIPAVANTRERCLATTSADADSFSRLAYRYCGCHVPHLASQHWLNRILTIQLRNEWGYKYWVTGDAGSVDLLITTHGTCVDRECAARTAVENISGEMGGGTYTYLTLPGTSLHRNLFHDRTNAVVQIKFERVISVSLTSMRL